jgi:hypothetical protein
MIMNELTDLEICQRIAEIEGVTDTVNVAIEAISNQKYNSIFNPNNITSPPTFDDIYNPLTDDALCFKLMVKYKITVEFTRYYESLKSNTIKAFYNDVGYGSYIRDINPNKAICLAIIKSKAIDNG